MKSMDELKEGLASGSEEVWALLFDLATIVQRKHYPKYEDPEDLISDGVVKAVEMVQQDKLEGQYRSVRSYLYTAIRNRMSNRLYEETRKTVVPFEELGDEAQEFDSQELEYTKSVTQVFLDLDICYSRYKQEVIRYIESLIRGERIDIKEPAPTLKERNLERLLALSLWRLSYDAGVQS